MRIDREARQPIQIELGEVDGAGRSGRDAEAPQPRRGQRERHCCGHGRAECGVERIDGDDEDARRRIAEDDRPSCADLGDRSLNVDARRPGRAS